MGRPFGEIGVSGLNRFGHTIIEDFISELTMPRNLKVYREMSLNDPVITAVLYMAEQLMKFSKWHVEPASESKADIAAAEFVEECMHDMSHTWADFISEVMTMFVYGWSWHEKVYKRRKDGRVGWKRLPGRSQHTWGEWAFHLDGDVKGMMQVAPPDFKPRYMPLSKSLLFRTTAIRDNPEGKSMLRGAYRPWYFKKRIEEIEGIGIERDLAGLPVLQVPEGVDIWDRTNEVAQTIRAQAEAVVRNIRRDQNEGLLLPAGWIFTLATTGSRRQFDTNAIIGRYDQRIAITLLSDIVMLGSEKVGSYALADAKESLMAVALEAQLDNIAAIMNKYAVPELIDLNVFPGITGYPKMTHGEVEVPALDELSRYIATMSGAGAQLFPDENLENFLRRIASLPKKDIDPGFELTPEDLKPNKEEGGGTGASRGNQARTKPPKENKQNNEV